MGATDSARARTTTSYDAPANYGPPGAENLARGSADVSLRSFLACHGQFHAAAVLGIVAPLAFGLIAKPSRPFAGRPAPKGRLDELVALATLCISSALWLDPASSPTTRTRAAWRVRFFENTTQCAREIQPAAFAHVTFPSRG